MSCGTRATLAILGCNKVATSARSIESKTTEGCLKLDQSCVSILFGAMLTKKQLRVPGTPTANHLELLTMSRMSNRGRGVGVYYIIFIVGCKVSPLATSQNETSRKHVVAEAQWRWSTGSLSQDPYAGHVSSWRFRNPASMHAAQDPNEPPVSPARRSKFQLESGAFEPIVSLTAQEQFQSTCPSYYSRGERGDPPPVHVCSDSSEAEESVKSSACARETF
ncbi:hypothetical protein P692DRAFT_20822597 [Suillus brevipes Sb2]|nr:hypothetical protein P692DRAFT_20822597 [Suillus brevipes Sb2]